MQFKVIRIFLSNQSIAIVSMFIIYIKTDANPLYEPCNAFEDKALLIDESKLISEIKRHDQENFGVNSQI